MRGLMVVLPLILGAIQAAAQSRSSDETAIRAQTAAFERAVNERNSAAESALFTHDGDEVFFDGPMIVGREAIRRDAQTTLSTWPPARRIALTVSRVRFLGRDVAIVDTRARFSDGAMQANRGTSVMVRQGGKWLLASLRVFPDQRP